jgi:CHAD domain-containing protein
MTPKPARSGPNPAAILERSRGVFFAQWGELLRLRRSVMKTSDLDDIHDLRVASRRFRAALDLFCPFAQKGSETELKKSVRNLTRILGGLRNIDEAKLFFQSRAQADDSFYRRLCPMLSERRSGELKRIQKLLAAFDHRNLDRMVRGMVAGLTDDTLSDRTHGSLLAYFSDVSISRYLPILQTLVVATAPDRPTSRHALRIAIKKWRYFLEIVAPILERDYAPLLELLKEYQSLLGRMNDIVEFEVLLGNLDLSPDEQAYVKATLRAEDTRLLESFIELVERKPLTYTFLI